MIALLAVAVGLVTGCSTPIAQSGAPAVEQSSPAPTPTPTPTVSPTPTPEPTPDVAKLGRQYLALLAPYNVLVCSFDDGMTTDLARYKAYDAAVAQAERKFTDALRALKFPEPIQSHVDARIAAGANFSSVVTLISEVTSFEEVNALQARLTETNFAVRDASNLIRGDLGLPDAPTCDQVNAQK
jgi:hypothetical protein